MSEIEELAEAYTRKYNGWRTEDTPESEQVKYSCDGCGQNVKALKAAYIAGARKLLELAEKHSEQAYIVMNPGNFITIERLRALVGGES